MAILTYDIGSLPRGSGGPLRPGSDEFREAVVRGLLDKLRAGIDIPNYPQFRDMISMFTEMLEGVEVVGGKYVAIGKVRPRAVEIPEVSVIRREAQRVRELAGGDVRLKVCVTGPYTLSAAFRYRSPDLIEQLGHALREIVEASVFKLRGCEVAMLSLDEPSLGFLDDPLLEPGSEGREALIRAWERIFSAARSRGVETAIHLHTTSLGIFWEVPSLRVVESHVDDPIYSSPRAREMLERADKVLKASVCITDFGRLIEEALRGSFDPSTLPSAVAEAWRRIGRGEEDPRRYLEGVDVMRRRLRRVVELVGEERVPYAGPECGLGGFPTYEAAIECLRRVSEAARL